VNDSSRHRISLITARYAARQAEKYAGDRRAFDESFRAVAARVIRPVMDEIARELREAGHAPRVAIDEFRETPSIELALGVRGAPEEGGMNRIGFAVIDRRGRPEVLVYLVVRPPPMDIVRFESPDEIAPDFVEQKLVDSLEHIFACHSV
jgi:hypothetical protein